MSSQSLILWRHADADDSYPDEERALTPKGLKLAKKIGAWLHERMPADIQIFSSPAKRALQTAEFCQRKYKILTALDTSTTPEKILAHLDWPRFSYLLVGHQPTLGKLASLVVVQQELPWPIGKGTAWWLEMDGVITVKAVISKGCI